MVWNADCNWLNLSQWTGGKIETGFYSVQCDAVLQLAEQTQRRTWKMFEHTWTTLTTKKRETGSVKMTRSKDTSAMNLANIPGPSSQLADTPGLDICLNIGGWVIRTVSQVKLNIKIFSRCLSILITIKFHKWSFLCDNDRRIRAPETSRNMLWVSYTIHVIGKLDRLIRL